MMNQPPPNLEFLARSANGLDVYYDPVHSHAATHFMDTPLLKGSVIGIINGLNVTGDTIRQDFDTKQIVGYMDLVDVTPDDTIIYAKRLNRDNFTPFAPDKKPIESSIVSLVLSKLEHGYLLYTAWVGGNVPSLPGSPGESDDSIPFWNTHALAWGTQEVDESSITTTRPW